MNPDMVFNIVPDDELDAYIATRAPGLTYITDKIYAHASDYTIELDAHASIAAVNRETGLRVLVLLKYRYVIMYVIDTIPCLLTCTDGAVHTSTTLLMNDLRSKKLGSILKALSAVMYGASPHERYIHVVPMYTKSTLPSTGVLCVYSVYVKGMTSTCTLTVTFCFMLILLLLLITVHDCNYFNRYLVLYLDGGYYIDSDIQCIKPFSAWHDFSASGASYKEAKAIIGIEFLTPDVQWQLILTAASLSQCGANMTAYALHAVCFECASRLPFSYRFGNPGYLLTAAQCST
eukprot:12122-Heterococcus_DN1.PRE.6